MSTTGLSDIKVLFSISTVPATVQDSDRIRCPFRFFTVGGAMRKDCKVISLCWIGDWYEKWSSLTAASDYIRKWLLFEQRLIWTQRRTQCECIFRCWGLWKQPRCVKGTTIKKTEFYAYRRSAVGQTQALVPLTVFRSNSKFNKNLECSSLKYVQLITTKFCTCHNRVTVMTCTKFHVIGRVYFKPEHSKSWSYFELDRKSEHKSWHSNSVKN